MYAVSEICKEDRWDDQQRGNFVRSEKGDSLGDQKRGTVWVIGTCQIPTGVPTMGLYIKVQNVLPQLIIFFFLYYFFLGPLP